MAVLFYVFAALAVVAALSVVLQRTPVYSALSLIVVLCALAVIYLLLGAEFMAAIQVIVYAGAIMVLFVLVIMLLNAGREKPSERSRLAHWLGVPLLAAFLIEVFAVVWRQFPPGATRYTALPKLRTALRGDVASDSGGGAGRGGAGQETALRLTIWFLCHTFWRLA
jgi:NADH:ubiquinone oxidoreductase subunit 6 (subunit J)